MKSNERKSPQLSFQQFHMLESFLIYSRGTLNLASIEIPSPKYLVYKPEILYKYLPYC